jgi:hypothetical protein
VRTPPHIAVVLMVDRPSRELEKAAVFWTEACRRQMLEHVGPAWELEWAAPPGVAFYGTGDGLPSDVSASVAIVEDAEVEGAAGLHSAVGIRVFGVVDLSRSSKPSKTLSHEIAEIYRNPYLDEWKPSPVPGRAYAVELCDPVQRNEYVIKARILGETREVVVGDFLTPAWFEPSAQGSRSHTGAVYNSFEVASGGYQIALEGDNILYLPSKDGAIGRNTITRPLSRTALISQRVTVQKNDP